MHRIIGVQALKGYEHIENIIASETSTIEEYQNLVTYTLVAIRRNMDPTICNFHKPSQDIREIIRNTENSFGKHASNLMCNRCKSKNISVELKQTRSADEATTCFVTCECGHKWKM